MTSKLVTDYLRDLAKRLELVRFEVPKELLDWKDIEQLIDLADTLDEERESK